MTGTERPPNHRQDEKRPRPLGKRLAWFVGLWAAGVAVVAGLSYLIRWLLVP